MSEIDWNTELRKIEREYSGLPPEPSPAQARMKREMEKAASERKAQRRGQLGVYVRLVPVLALGASLLLWPYPSRCGMPLAAYLGAIAAAALGALWLLALTWKWRMPITHLLAMALVAWAALVAGRELLPRVGYAKPDPARPPGFHCAARAAATK